MQLVMQCQGCERVVPMDTLLWCPVCGGHRRPAGLGIRLEDWSWMLAAKGAITYLASPFMAPSVQLDEISIVPPPTDA